LDVQKMAKFIDGFLGTGDQVIRRKPERPDLDAQQQI
jgi:hypothetical protein